MFFSNILATVLLAASVAFAVPVAEPHELLVVNPRIISPKASSSWVVGSKQNVTWDTSEIPHSRLNATGVLLLGHGSKGSENLDIKHALAMGFPLVTGRVEVLMPKNVIPRKNYFVVLFGDSGNTSEEFAVRRA